MPPTDTEHELTIRILKNWLPMGKEVVYNRLT